MHSSKRLRGSSLDSGAAACAARAPSPISADIATLNRRLKRAALHVVAPGVLAKQGVTLKPNQALQKEDLPFDKNALTKLGKVTRKLRSELINWAEDGRPGESMAKDIATQKLNLWP